MAHKLQLENKKYRNWVKAGLGTKYVKDGLEPFCDHLVNQQHTYILTKVKKKHNLSVVSCRLCDVRTLQPDHVRTRSRQCPLGQIHCNCQHPSGKITCPYNVCGAIYDEIIQFHAFTPPAPYWKNTDAQQWCTEPWAIAKCFINAPGYEQKTKAAEFDCPGLLHMLMNNIEFQHHIKCGITGTDVFSRVRKSRNEIFHSHTMELEDTEVNSYIDDMIELLEDEIEIKHRQESKDAVKNLLELKQEDFIITTTDEAKIRRIAMAEIGKKEIELKQTIVDAGNEIITKTAKGKHELEGKGLVIKSDIEQTVQKIRKELVVKDNEIKTKAAECKHDIEGKGLIMKSELEQIGKKIKKELVIKDDEIRATAAEDRRKLDDKGLVIKAELEQTITKIKKELVVKDDEIRATASEGKRGIEGKCLIIKSELEQKGKEITKELIMKGGEIRATAAEGKHKLQMKGLVIQTELQQTRKELNQKGIELEKQLTMKEKEIEGKLEQKLQESKLQLENAKTLNEVSIKDNTDTKPKAENKRQKAEFQEKLVKLYKKYASRVPSFPLQPKRKLMDVSDIYVPPLMTINIQDEKSNEWKEVPISMQELFKNTETPAKSIYVLGEAGSGKSMFSKILVHFWCIAHSNPKCSLGKYDMVKSMFSKILVHFWPIADSYPECSLDEYDMVKEMGRFEFLFYVLLRNCSDCCSIEEMLEKLYHDPALRDILQNESNKCLIVLDGLDEWAPERKHNSQFLTPGLPGRELDADYTIITTSRQWKFDALPITDSEVDKKIKLRGIAKNEIKVFTEKTVNMLNETFHQSKNAEKCKVYLQSRPVSDISHIPLILQQLIFLWFDDKLRENSKYAIYSNMLALLLKWKALKSSENQECDMITQDCLLYSPLPDYLCQFDIFHENTRVIQYLSYLAYETLFDKNKETTLTFSRSTLKRLNVPNDVIKFCLNVGILIEEENVSLHASMSQQSSFSFFHKSIQEYLAAVYVASQFKEMVNSQKLLQKDKREHTDIRKECVLNYFQIGSCERVLDILEQSNVFIMLCGLEPQLLTNVSEYIYNVATVDSMVVEERYTLPEEFPSKDNKLIKAVQACISSCIDEVMSSEKNVHKPVYIADLYVSDSADLVHYGKNIVLENALSVDVDAKYFSFRKSDKKPFYVLLECFTKCDQLKVIKVNAIHHDSRDWRIINAVTEILVTNVSTLETISLININKNTEMLSLLVSIIPKMRRLVSLHMKGSFSKVSHEVFLSLSEVLSQTTSLQHISLDIMCNKCEHHNMLICEKCDRHMIDLSKNKQLQHVDISFKSFRVVNCNTDNLETCKLNVSSSNMKNQLCNSLYKACKLKHLDLNGFSRIGDHLAGAITEDRPITENLIRLLPSLVSISTLKLTCLAFTDNIITCPSDMKNLKEIKLGSVKMSMTTWCKFIDSLPALPQSVHVQISLMFIRDETSTGYCMFDKNQVANALEYVKKRANLFRVTRNTYTYDNQFEFTTRKVEL